MIDVSVIKEVFFGIPCFMAILSRLFDDLFNFYIALRKLEDLSSDISTEIATLAFAVRVNVTCAKKGME